MTFDLKSGKTQETPTDVESYDQLMPISHVVCKRTYIFKDFWIRTGNDPLMTFDLKSEKTP